MTIAIVALALTDVGLGENNPRNDVFDYVLCADGVLTPVKIEVTRSLAADITIETDIAREVVTMDIASVRGTVTTVCYPR
ncbi:hypothetical protein FPV67DRAFT_1672322 [Lyophyllum atratum]|nr:hypothetical protein FPV67DRAFT_1672322 [Lyophyllum atratum]